MIRFICLALSLVSIMSTGGYAEKVPSQPKVTFVELGSVNCMPCKMMKPVMADIEKEYAGSVKVVFYDVWTEEGQVYGKQYKIKAIPTQVFLDKDGNEFFRHLGFYPTEEIVKLLEKQGIKKSAASPKSSKNIKNSGENMTTGTVCK